MSLLDLHRTYLQIKVSESLWPFQIMMFNVRRYCQTRLGVRLNVAPQIMKSVISTVLSQEKATLVHLDNSYINKDIVMLNV